jgi:hypothetical protein
LCFAVREIDGKGKGVVALRDIAPGERLLCESPLVMWEMAAGRRAESAPGHEAELEALLSRLDADARLAFYDLCDEHTQVTPTRDGGADGGGRGGSGGRGGGGDAESGWHHTRKKTASGIWASNAFTIHEGDSFLPVDDGVLRAAVFGTAARFNHSCSPSCHAAWSPSARKQTIHAVRRISQGEELTIAYLSGTAHKPRAERQRELERMYKFECACEACKLKGAARDASDARRRRLGEVSERVLGGSGDGLSGDGLSGRAAADRGGGAAASLPAPPKGDMPQLVEELWSLMKEEGLPLVWQRCAVIAAMRGAKESGDPATALRWAMRGMQSTRIGLGADAPATTTFEMVVRLWKGGAK